METCSAVVALGYYGEVGERWNDGLLGFSKGTIIPASFRENMGAGIVATYHARFILDTTDIEF